MSMEKVERALERTTDTKDLIIGAGVVSRTAEMFAKLFPGCKALLQRKAWKQGFILSLKSQ